MTEVALGRISDPVPWDAADRSLPVCRRFGVRQASSTGKVKLRVIDDFAENGVNAATGVSGRIRMASLRGLRAVARRLHRRDPSTPLVVLKADFKSAYRCAPILGPRLPFARLLLFNPLSSSLFVASQWAMPFGAIGAVYAWDRIGSAVTQVLARLFWLPVLRYVDDLFLVVPADLAAGAYEALHSCVAALGLVLDPDKSPPASPSAVVLGVTVSCAPTRLVFSVDPSKVAFWVSELEALSASPSHRALTKMVGRLSFGAYAVWGPRVAAHLPPLFSALARGIPRSGPSALLFLSTLDWWRSFLLDSLGSSQAVDLPAAALPPAVLYSDAEGDGGLGACLHVYSSWQWWQTRTPASVRSLHTALGFPQRFPIFLLEAIVPFLALRRWSSLLRGQRLLLFVDNLTLLVVTFANALSGPPWAPSPSRGAERVSFPVA